MKAKMRMLNYSKNTFNKEGLKFRVTNDKYKKGLLFNMQNTIRSLCLITIGVLSTGWVNADANARELEGEAIELSGNSNLGDHELSLPGSIYEQITNHRFGGKYTIKGLNGESAKVTAIGGVDGIVRIDTSLLDTSNGIFIEQVEESYSVHIGNASYRAIFLSLDPSVNQSNCYLDDGPDSLLVMNGPTTLVAGVLSRILLESNETSTNILEFKSVAMQSVAENLGIEICDINSKEVEPWIKAQLFKLDLLVRLLSQVVKHVDATTQIESSKKATKIISDLIYDSIGKFSEPIFSDTSLDKIFKQFYTDESKMNESVRAVLNLMFDYLYHENISLKNEGILYGKVDLYYQIINSIGLPGFSDQVAFMIIMDNQPFDINYEGVKKSIADYGYKIPVIEPVLNGHNESMVSIINNQGVQVEKVVQARELSESVGSSSYIMENNCTQGEESTPFSNRNLISIEGILPGSSIEVMSPYVDIGLVFDCDRIKYYFSEGQLGDNSSNSENILTISYTDTSHRRVIKTLNLAIDRVHGAARVNHERTSRDDGNGKKFESSRSHCHMFLDSYPPRITGSSIINLSEDSEVIVALDSTNKKISNLNMKEYNSPIKGELIFLLDGRFIYKTLKNAVGEDSFSIIVWDETGFVIKEYSVFIDAVNDNPNITSGSSFEIDEDTQLTNTPTAEDPDTGDQVTFGNITQPNHGTVTYENGQHIYTPNPHFHGEDSYSYEADDQNGGKDKITVNVTVVSKNDNPNITSGSSFEIDEDTQLTNTPTAEDPDTGDQVTFGNITQPNHGTVTYENGQHIYTPYLYYYGSDSYSFEANDGNGGMDTQTINININSKGTFDDGYGLWKEGFTDSEVVKPILAEFVTYDKDNGYYLLNNSKKNSALENYYLGLIEIQAEAQADLETTRDTHKAAIDQLNIDIANLDAKINGWSTEIEQNNILLSDAENQKDLLESSGGSQEDIEDLNGIIIELGSSNIFIQGLIDSNTATKESDEELLAEKLLTYNDIVDNQIPSIGIKMDTIYALLDGLNIGDNSGPEIITIGSSELIELIEDDRVLVDLSQFLAGEKKILKSINGGSENSVEFLNNPRQTVFEFGDNDGGTNYSGNIHLQYWVGGTSKQQGGLLYFTEKVFVNNFNHAEYVEKSLAKAVDKIQFLRNNASISSEEIDLSRDSLDDFIQPIGDSVQVKPGYEGLFRSHLEVYAIAVQESLMSTDTQVSEKFIEIASELALKEIDKIDQENSTQLNDSEREKIKNLVYIWLKDIAVKRVVSIIMDSSNSFNLEDVTIDTMKSHLRTSVYE